jgi:nitroreductase
MSARNSYLKFPIHELLANRWSPRAFSTEAIPTGILRRIFEAARQAPSAYNDQPWHFVIAPKGSSEFEAILDALVDWNKLWAGSSPMLVLACSKRFFSNKPDVLNKVASYDTGQAVAHLSIQAMHEDVYVHQMSGFDINKMTSNLSLSESMEPVCVLALGFLGEKETLPEDIAALENGFKPRNEFLSFVSGTAAEELFG